MKKINFLNKLYKEEKLKKVKPSKEVTSAYLEKSAKSLSSAKALLDIGNLEDSVALAYYAMYHSILALLFRIGIKCENHTAAIVLLEKVFKVDNKQIAKAKKERIDKQYYVDFEVTKTETEEAIQAAEEFLNNITDFIEKLKEEEIEQYRKKAAALMR